MEEFIVPIGITRNKLAIALGILPCRICEIVHGKCRIIADTALRLGRYIGVTAQFWNTVEPEAQFRLRVFLVEWGLKNAA